jgi:cytochrome c556
MRLALLILSTATALAFLGCQKQAEPVLLKHAMKNVVSVEMQSIWDITGAAFNDAGDVDGSKLNEADWSKIAAAAEKLRIEMTALRDQPIRVAAAGEKLDGEGAPGALDAAHVQALIDKNPSEFKAKAAGMLAASIQMETAAMAHDAAELGRVSGEVDQVCEVCHQQFWYPSQK